MLNVAESVTTPFRPVTMREARRERARRGMSVLFTPSKVKKQSGDTSVEIINMGYGNLSQEDLDGNSGN